MIVLTPLDSRPIDPNASECQHEHIAILPDRGGRIAICRCGAAAPYETHREWSHAKQRVLIRVDAERRPLQWLQYDFGYDYPAPDLVEIEAYSPRDLEIQHLMQLRDDAGE